MILEIILAGIIQWNTLNKNIEETNGTQLSTYILPHNQPNDTISFILGDSRFQIDERERQANEEAERVRLASQPRGSSYTGAGTQVAIIGISWENCVQFAKRQTGIRRSIGGGGRTGINSYEPQVGAIGAERGVVHAVVIERIDGNLITIIEANWYRGKITRRVLTRSNFIGFII